MSEIPVFSVSVVRSPEGQTVVSVVGDLDLGAASKLRSSLLEALDCRVTVLDLSGCTFCDSAGLRTMLEAAHRAKLAHTSFRVAGVPVVVARVLALAEAEAHLDMYPDVRTALKA